SRPRQLDSRFALLDFMRGAKGIGNRPPTPKLHHGAGRQGSLASPFTKKRQQIRPQRLLGQPPDLVIEGVDKVQSASGCGGIRERTIFEPQQLRQVIVATLTAPD